MSVLVVYARLYAECLKKALAGIRQNLWTLLLPMALMVAYQLVAGFVGRLGFVGGILLALAFDAAASAYLYFLGEIVSQSKVRIEELKRSIGPFFWSVLNLMFVLWIARMLLGMLVAGSAQGGVLFLVFQLAVWIVLNAAPEVIYQRGTYGGLQTVQRSISFLQANWIEWFIPNLLLLGAGYGVLTLGMQVGRMELLVPLSLLLGALLHVAMVFRGHLFAALDGSSHRQRMFKFRNAL